MIEQSGEKGCRKKTNHKWYELQDNTAYYNDFAKEKIIFSKASKEQAFCYDTSGSITLNTSYILTGKNLKYLLVVLNSKLSKFMFLNYYQSGGIKGEITVQAIEIIPIPKIEKEQPFIEKADLMLSLNKELQQTSGNFTQLLQSKFSIEKLTTKLQNWYELEFGEFLKELEKARKVVSSTTRGLNPLSLQQQAEWMQYFNEQKQKVQALKSEINRVDAEIDKMVYELYGLTEEEIKIVERKN